MAKEINAPPTPPLSTHFFNVDDVLLKLTNTEKIGLLSGEIPTNPLLFVLQVHLIYSISTDFLRY
jgi:hypothetical protein